jgi:predicted DNA-binding transcriptional regulator AlpA
MKQVDISPIGQPTDEVVPIKKPVNISQFGQLPDEAQVSIKKVATLIDSGISTAWRYLATDPTFPKPIRLSARCTRFRVGDVRAWIASKG